MLIKAPLCKVHPKAVYQYKMGMGGDTYKALHTQVKKNLINKQTPEDVFPRFFFFRHACVAAKLDAPLLSPTMGWRGQGSGLHRGQAAVVAPRSQQQSQ